MLKQEVLNELKKIGFAQCESPSEKKHPDNKNIFIWTYPIKNSNHWFSVKLIEDNGEYFVETASNQADKKYISINIFDFIQFINSELITN